MKPLDEMIVMENADVFIEQPGDLTDRLEMAEQDLERMFRALPKHDGAKARLQAIISTLNDLRSEVHDAIATAHSLR